MQLFLLFKTDSHAVHLMGIWPTAAGCQGGTEGDSHPPAPKHRHSAGESDFDLAKQQMKQIKVTLI